MATRTQKMQVGLFLIVSAVFIVGGILLVTGLRTGKEIRYWITFTESILGLNAGSKVVYRGVPVGTVDNIRVSDDSYARVEILVDPEKITLREGVSAGLAYLSIATGTMCVALEGGDPNAPLLAPNANIPARTSWLQSYDDRITTLMDKVNDLADDLSRVFSGMTEEDLSSFMKEAKNTLEEAKTTIQEVRASIKNAGDRFGEGVETFTQEVKPLDLAKIQNRIEDVLKELESLPKSISAALDAFNATSREIAHEADNVEYNLRQTLQTWSQTLEAIRDLAEYLKQDPSALVRGKGKPGGGQ